MNTTIYQQKITKKALFIFFIGTAFFCYAFFVQVAPIAMTNQLMRDFLVNASGLGILAGTFYWTYTIMQIPAGLILDRFGVRSVLTIVALLCTLGVLIFALAINIRIAEIGRMLMGASCAFSFTAAILLVVRWLPPRSLAMFVGIIQMIGCIGSIAAVSLLGEILHFYPWRSVMLVLVVIGTIIAILTFALVRNKPQTYKEEISQKPKVWQALKTVIRNPQSWFVAIYAFAIWGPIWAFAALWGVPFLKEAVKDISTLQAGEGVSLIWVAIAISSPLAGWISDKIGRRCIILTISAIIGIAASLSMIMISHLSLWVLYVLLFLIGIAAGGQALSFGVVKDNNPSNIAGVANGFNNMTIALSGAVLQPLIGKLLDLNWIGLAQKGIRIYTLHTYQIALMVLPACFLLAAIMSIFLIKETYCKSVWKKHK